MERKEITVNLPGIDRPAIIVLTRAGQISPDKGDDVQVGWELQLPADDGTIDLHSECRFGDRVGPVCGANLCAEDWGEMCIRRPGYVPYVTESGIVSGRTWPEAFGAAEDYVLGELNKLVTALRARQRALAEAEEE